MSNSANTPRGLVLALCLPFLAMTGTAALAEPELTFVATGKVADKDKGFDEPSGLALAADGETLWSVSDNSPRLYRIARDGKLVEHIKLGSKMDDLEGVAWDAARSRILLVRERSAEVIELDPEAPEQLVRHALRDMEGYDKVAAIFSAGDANKGLEGIAVMPETGTVFLIKENEPRMLLELSSDLTRILGGIVLDAAMGFAGAGVDDVELDVSDIVWDARRKAFWITSDTGRRVFLFDPVARKALGYRLLWSEHDQRQALHHAEGIALSSDDAQLFVVTDDGHDSRMVEYAIGDGS